ncbi:Flp pilus assembly protein CpaB [Paractinoplanes hotanensis]|uniref:RcpC/CpaB family pilus assembly protein n=1 Tax=Paractinoplanes hotanensis TaxID=2906497 RepID=A0ABT0XXL1_9ACTN|nr:RcpC/CpaB family pilus assembly protein [Actinoplanes hotanensis]MCM4077854.1 RcpC/CpaB family pilus assembly protein [Actinoplanes hotanensis]
MSRRIVLLGVAAVLAILSAVAVVAYASGADRRAVEGKKGVWVLLATEAIPSGTTGAQIRSRRLVRQVLMPAETVPSGALTKLGPALDAKALNATLQPDQMLLTRQFDPAVKAVPKPAATFKVPPKQLAISVELGIARQVAGNVKRGDKVTVYVTAPKDDTAENPQKTWVVLPTATVLSVGESVPPNIATLLSPSGQPHASGSAGASPAPSPTTTVTLLRYVATLAVTPDQAEALINGYNRGYLHLALQGAKATVTATPTVVESGDAG